MTWYVVQCFSGREERAQDDMRRHGVEGELFAPYEKVQNTSKRGPQYRRVMLAPGYVFVDFGSDDPLRLVDVCRMVTTEAIPGLGLRVLAPAGVPYPLSDDIMGQMRTMPERLRQIVDDAEAAERAAGLAKMPRAGRPARITSGALAGQVLPVDHVADGWVHFGGTVKAKARIEDCELSA